MDSNAIREEHDVLDHQRARIEEILSHKIVSPEMARDLRRRLDYIDRRLTEMSVSVSEPVGSGQSGVFG